VLRLEALLLQVFPDQAGNESRFLEPSNATVIVKPFRIVAREKNLDSNRLGHLCPPARILCERKVTFVNRCVQFCGNLKPEVLSQADLVNEAKEGQAIRK